jgi:hypothetical protein
MPEIDLADQFSREVDDRLKAGSRQRARSAPPEYQAALDLAQRLAAADFSGESRKRLALRQRLLHQAYARQRSSLSVTRWSSVLFARLLRRSAVAVGAGIAVLLIHLAWSGTLQVGASQLNAALRENLRASHVNQFLSSLAPMTPVTTTLGTVVEPWSPALRPEQVAISGVPAGSTTVSVGNVVSFGSPP